MGKCRELEVAAVGSCIWIEVASVTLIQLEERKAMRTKLAHAAQMSLDPALVLDERLIARTMPVDPVAYCLSQGAVVGFSTIDLRICHS